MSKKKTIQYEFLLELLTKHPNVSPIELLSLLNKKLEENQLPEVKERTLDSLIADLRKGNLNKKPVNIVYQNGGYSIANHKLNFYLNELTEEVRNSIPFLNSILSKFQYIPSVKLFYDNLQDQIEKNKDIINENSAVVTINNHQRLEDMNKQMALVNKLLNFINKHEMIEFSYQSTSEGNVKEKDKPAIVHPLQIRQYLGKFYLVAATIEEPYIIRTYLLDNFQKNIYNEYRLAKFIPDYEDDEIMEITDYEVYLKQLKLDTHFDHCIGIMRDHKAHPVEIRRWFKGWAATAVMASPLHPSQIVLNPEKTYEDGRVQIRINVFDNEELKNHLARFGKYSWGIHEEEPEI